MNMTTGTRITVRRPNGEVEVIMQRGKYYSADAQRKVIEATRAAGRGEVLDFEVVEAEVPAETDTERLRRQRRDLVATVRGMIDESDAVFEAAHAREDARAWTIKAEADRKVDAAWQALAVFDAEHPEILRELQAETQANAERHMWD
jgi:hypothetical protein